MTQCVATYILLIPLLAPVSPLSVSDWDQDDDAVAHHFQDHDSDCGMETRTATATAFASGIFFARAPGIQTPAYAGFSISLL